MRPIVNVDPSGATTVKAEISAPLPELSQRTDTSPITGVAYDPNTGCHNASTDMVKATGAEPKGPNGAVSTSTKTQTIKAALYMAWQLIKGHGILVRVDKKDSTGTHLDRHALAIRAVGVDKKGVYFKAVDPGTANKDMAGTVEKDEKMNIVTFRMTDGRLVGERNYGSHKTYIINQYRENIEKKK